MRHARRTYFAISIAEPDATRRDTRHDCQLAYRLRAQSGWDAKASAKTNPAWSSPCRWIRLREVASLLRMTLDRRTEAGSAGERLAEEWSGMDSSGRRGGAALGSLPAMVFSPIELMDLPHAGIDSSVLPLDEGSKSRVEVLSSVSFDKSSPFGRFHEAFTTCVVIRVRRSAKQGSLMRCNSACSRRKRIAYHWLTFGGGVAGGGA